MLKPITALLLFAAAACAQEARPVQCRFLAFAVADALSSVITLSNQGTDIECPLSSTELSPQITCFAKGNAIAFLNAGTREPVVAATIPPNVKSALLIFIGGGQTPNDPAQTKTKVLVIEDSPKNFPDGGAYIANFHQSPIRFVVGEHKGMLKPGGSHGYALPKQRDSFNMAPVIFEFLKGDSWHIANESALRFLPGVRYLIFAYVDPQSGRPRINTCQDIVR